MPGSTKVYEASRKGGPIVEVSCWGKPRTGYRLACEPERISAADILRALSKGDELIGGLESRSRILWKVVIPALVSAEDAGSQVLQRLTIHSLAISAIE
jgi:DNA-binding IscR family transcriptional regulator